MKENKDKGLISGNKVVQTEDDAPAQTCQTALKVLKLIPPSSSEKRKTVSKTVNTGNLPSH